MFSLLFPFPEGQTVKQFFSRLVLVPHLVSLVKGIEMLPLPTKGTCVLTLSGINSQVQSAIRSRIFLNG